VTQTLVSNSPGLLFICRITGLSLIASGRVPSTKSTRIIAAECIAKG
jgi:hypothetical protein